MDIDCIICLNKTNTELRHHLCCQCGKLVCDVCLEKKQIKELKLCPHCKYKSYNKVNLTRLFRLTERENIDNSLVYNIMGCHLIFNNVRKRGIECLKISNSYLANQNLKFANGEKGDYYVRFDVEDYCTDLLCVKQENIKDFIEKYKDILDKKPTLQCVKSLFDNDNIELCLKIAERFKEDGDFLIYILVCELHNFGGKKRDEDKERFKELALEIEKLAEENISFAIFEIAIIYMSNKYLDRNYKKAHDYFSLLPIESNSLFWLSYIYKEGLGVEKDVVKCFEYLGKAYKYNENCFYEYSALFEDINSAINTEYKTFTIDDEDDDDDDDYDDDDDDDDDLV